MPNNANNKIVSTALLVVITAVLLFHFWPVVVGLLALIGLAVLIIALLRF